MSNGNCKDCLKLYFAYTDKLKKRSDYYLNNYSVSPVFKAGVNCGKVTVAEIGEIKSEIAYHGDVLNTAARIQGKCNEFDENLLISENMVTEGLNEIYVIEDMGEMQLRGKLDSINVFSVKEHEKSSTLV
ncbi:MAG: hypothetical protein KC414_13795 [Romboutsia sp.]|nr:hypothetical protein [Romboutsia sp.]